MAQSLQGRGRLNAFVTVAASQTDSAVVTAVANKKIRVVAMCINGTDAGASSVNFNTKPAGGGSAITPIFKVNNNTSLVLPATAHEGSGWFETNVGEGLTITSAAASAAVYMVVYEVVST